MSLNKYDIDDFLQNRSFVKWVKNPDKETNMFWEKWLLANANHKNALLQAKEILLLINFNHIEPEENDFNEVLQNILKNNEYKSNPSAQTLSKDRARFLMRIAASISFIALVSYFVFQNNTEVQKNETVVNKLITKSNQYGRKSKLGFSDGSTAVLNSGSSLKYLSRFNENVREVVLQGEAFFEVEKEEARPFRVVSGDLTATVLGTSFDIQAYDAEAVTIIELKTGMIRVENSKNSEIYTLEPGQRLTYNNSNGNFELSKIDPGNIALWTQGVLVFENDNIETIAKKLEQWFDVEITHQGLDGNKISFSSTYKNENLNNILISMGFALDFEFSISGKEVHIVAKK